MLVGRFGVNLISHTSIHREDRARDREVHEKLRAKRERNKSMPCKPFDGPITRKENMDAWRAEKKEKKKEEIAKAKRKVERTEKAAKKRMEAEARKKQKALRSANKSKAKSQPSHQKSSPRLQKKVKRKVKVVKPAAKPMVPEIKVSNRIENQIERLQPVRKE
jgi:hypothetical protein